MYSLNAPVPSAVARIARELAAELPEARARARGDHTLLVKRLGEGTDGRPDHLVSRAREALAGTDPFEVRVTGVGCFEEPETGTGPVVYLAVESPALEALHRRLCETFEPVAHLEDEAYVPHVTVARGGTLANARDLLDRSIQPVSVEVSELVVRDARREFEAARIPLPR